MKAKIATELKKLEKKKRLTKRDLMWLFRTRFLTIDCVGNEGCKASVSQVSGQAKPI